MGAYPDTLLCHIKGYEKRKADNVVSTALPQAFARTCCKWLLVWISSSKALCKVLILCTSIKEWQEVDSFDTVFLFELDVCPPWARKYGGSCRFCRFSHLTGRWVGICCQLSPNPQLPFRKPHLCHVSLQGLAEIALTCWSYYTAETILSFLELNIAPHSLSSSTQIFLQD